MKHIKHWLATMAVLLCSITASAHDFEVGGIYYNITSSSDLTVTVTYRGNSHYDYYNEYSGAVTIPSTVTYNRKTYSVTSIGEDAFSGCSRLTSIALPESVTSIGNYTFYNCSSLTSITIPENSQLTSIGSYAFYGCSSLTSITLPESVTSIGSYAFYGCSCLTSITIPENSQLTSIGSYAFYGCSSLTSITIPENSQLTSIGNYTFYDCSSLTAINIPESVTSIGYDAFRGCSSLTTITLPASVTSIRFYAFSYCSSLTTITIPEGVASIGDHAFYGCSSLTSITIPENSQLTSIGGGTFSGCSKLTSIAIPESVTSIGEEAFYNCSGLTSITIPESVTSIGDYAFSYCSNLTSITIPENSQLTSIGNYTFYDCSSLTAITIPEGVTSIGNCAFEGCSGIKELTLGKGLKKIESSAFYGCTALEKVTIYATRPPTAADIAIFSDATYENATLYVPKGCIDKYKVMTGWSGFYGIVEMAVAVTSITLNQLSATLVEGDSLTLTATITPDDADDKTIVWSSSDPSVAAVDNTGKITAVASGYATITATANDGSGVSAQCEVTVESYLDKCEAPTISYVEGRVVLTCATEGAKVITDVVVEDAHRYEELEFALSATYTITAYATKAKYETSDVVTLTLCWITCTEDHETDDEDGIITIPSQPVLISTQGGTITLTGLADGTDVAVYTTAGTQLGTATAVSGTATITTSLTTGNTAIVKIGDRPIKVMVK